VRVAIVLFNRDLRVRDNRRLERLRAGARAAAGAGLRGGWDRVPRASRDDRGHRRLPHPP